MWYSEYKLLCLYRAVANPSPGEETGVQKERSSSSGAEGGGGSSLASGAQGAEGGGSSVRVRAKRQRDELEESQEKIKFFKEEELTKPSQESPPNPISSGSPFGIETLDHLFESLTLEKTERPYTDMAPSVRSILEIGNPTTISDSNFLNGVIFTLTTKNKLLYAYIRKIQYLMGEGYAEVCLINHGQEEYDNFISEFNERQNEMHIVKVWRYNYKPVYWKKVKRIPETSPDNNILEDEVLKYWLGLGYYHLPPLIELLLFNDPKFDTRTNTYYVQTNDVIFESYISYDYYLNIRDEQFIDDLRDMTMLELQRLNTL